MEFGLFSLSVREKEVAAEAWDEDLWEITTAEELGFQEAWIAEHMGGMRPDAMPASDLFICKAAGVTKHMRFGPGIRALPYHHPINVAMQAAVADHLTGGRYMAGFGGARTAPGPGGDYFRQYGVDVGREDKREMMHEAIDFILKCWSETQPFDFHGKFWHGEGIKVQPKPLQQPRMPVGLANSESISTAQLAGEKGFLPLHSTYDTAPQLRELDLAFLRAGRAAGRDPSLSDVRVARYIHVSDTVEQAKDEVREGAEANIQRLKKGPALLHLRRSLRPDQTDDDITFDHLVDAGVFFVGDPDTVYEQVKAFYDEVGGFGVLLFAVGLPVGSREHRKRSWTLFMEHVAPRLRGLDPDQAAGLTSVPTLA